jgi:hypothetical protein
LREYGAEEDIWASKRDDVTGEWRRLYALYASPNKIRVIKSRRLRWIEHVAYVGKRTGAYSVLMGKSEGHNLEDPGLDVRIV